MTPTFSSTKVTKISTLKFEIIKNIKHNFKNFLYQQMRGSDYEYVREIFVKCYGSENWMIEREARWATKTETQKKKRSETVLCSCRTGKFFG